MTMNINTNIISSNSPCRGSSELRLVCRPASAGRFFEAFLKKAPLLHPNVQLSALRALRVRPCFSGMKQGRDKCPLRFSPFLTLRRRGIPGSPGAYPGPREADRRGRALPLQADEWNNAHPAHSGGRTQPPDGNPSRDGYYI